jgi:lipopolysaccharide heptosyltransferase I
MEILIIRVSAIGDTIHTLPAIALLKNHNPNIKISWVVQEKVSSLLSKQQFLENVFVLPDKFLKPKNLFKTFCVLKEIKKTKWDAIIDFQGILKTTILLSLLKGKKFGFDKNHARLDFTTRFTHYHSTPIYTNIIQKNLSLASLVLQTLDKTIKTCPTIQSLHKNFSLRIPPKKQYQIISWLAQNNIKNGIILAPNTTWESKHWPIDNWKQLLKLFVKKPTENHSIILVGKDFGEHAKKLAEFIKQNNLPFFIAPKCDLITTAFLIKQSKLLIAPDTGLLHLADFIGIKTIGIFGPTQARKHGPFLTYKNIKNTIQISCPHFQEKTHHGKNCMNTLSANGLYKQIISLTKLIKPFPQKTKPANLTNSNRVF